MGTGIGRKTRRRHKNLLSWISAGSFSDDSEVGGVLAKGL
ncbi:unnamed protein product [Rhodiola kirilowii]